MCTVGTTRPAQSRKHCTSLTLPRLTEPLGHGLYSRTSTPVCAENSVSRTCLRLPTADAGVSREPLKGITTGQHAPQSRPHPCAGGPRLPTFPNFFSPQPRQTMLEDEPHPSSVLIPPAWSAGPVFTLPHLCAFPVTLPLHTCSSCPLSTRSWLGSAGHPATAPAGHGPPCVTALLSPLCPECGVPAAGGPDTRRFGRTHFWVGLHDRRGRPRRRPLACAPVLLRHEVPRLALKGQ